MTPRLLTRPVTAGRDLVLLITRIGLGVIFIAHGWQKFSTNGLDGTVAGFTKLGIPAPTLSAYFATAVELLGGAALILGLLTPLVSALLAVNMLGAFAFVHASNGVFVSQGGWELVITLALATLVLATTGPGKFSVDAAVSGSAKRQPVAA